MVNQMVMGYTLHLMVTNMKENGRLGKYMDKGYTLIRMVTNMKENGRLGKNLVREDRSVDKVNRKTNYSSL